VVFCVFKSLLAQAKKFAKLEHLNNSGGDAQGELSRKMNCAHNSFSVGKAFYFANTKKRKLQNKHSIAVAKKVVFFFDSHFISMHDEVITTKGASSHQKR